MDKTRECREPVENGESPDDNFQQKKTGKMFSPAGLKHEAASIKAEVRRKFFKKSLKNSGDSSLESNEVFTSNDRSLLELAIITAAIFAKSGGSRR